MADYYSQCVVSPMLPLGDLTAAERLILCNVFESETENDELYLFAEIGRNSMIDLELPDIVAALPTSTERSVAADLLLGAIARLPDDQTVAGIDLDDRWIDILQEIVRRSPTLTFIAIETGFNCSKMRPDGFGGSALVITADSIDAMSTSQFIDEALALRLGTATKLSSKAGGTDA
ncbi:hypothetical protein [Sphingobium algorifonticola]|uniref:Uncharacterized protein n=1 Tax=Sphingobium algorifonticola TaxID=2008318 RepID=A0A437J3G7_9SPHN|nr:hypothetical protein [Sphingobium algorifonticola]RVT39053.1 hypothetical protein ENE74_16480 [Sphingobium algorifonticola]